MFRCLHVLPAPLAICLIAFTAGSTLAGAPVPPDAVPMTAADIQQKIIGNTLVGGDFKEYYDSAGLIRGRQTGHPSEYHGNWHLAGDKMCFDYPKTPQYNSCNKLEIKGNQVYFLDDDGTQNAESPATLETGNAEDL